MSSWLSLNPFKSQQEPDQQQQEEEDSELEEDQASPSNTASVKEDLSELGKTLSRQLWGVASFLAPPPPTSASASSVGADPSSPSSSQTLLGIRNDFAEIGGSLKSGFSLISTNKAVNEISRLASNLLQFDQEEDREEDSGSGVVGITEEALQFVEEISLRPECWIDFPLPLDDYDFDIYNAQKEHVTTVEHLCPSLKDLRMKLCPDHITEERFWMIYFVLLHPRLNKHDSELLSTSQIVEVRNVLLETMQARNNAHVQTSTVDDLSLQVKDKGNYAQDECSMGHEKELLAETANAGHQEDTDVDRWLEEDVETGTSFNGRNPIINEQDVTFSDLEDDDSDTLSRQGERSPTQNVHSASPNGSLGWVQLSESSEVGDGRKKGLHPAAGEKDSEGEESNEWLTIDEFDSDNAGTV